ncbi:MAG: glutamate mutase L [Bacillota bacterium]
MESGRILAIDVGSTTTKALLFQKNGDHYRLTHRFNAPTTVEAPYEDVMVGVNNAIRGLEHETGWHLLEGGQLITPARAGDGVDLFACTSSAGGGLQMMVTGVMRELTAESAERAALGAGAVVLDIICLDDNKTVLEKVGRIRELRPDMILLAGGTDGGALSHVIAVAEFIRAAKPKLRFGNSFRLPVVYAANADGREQVREMLGGTMRVEVVPNIRPTLEEEHVEQARDEIHRLFLEHVMAEAPGYATLVQWSQSNILPTPAAVGDILQALAASEEANVVAVDIGGATTDVFSVMFGKFNRSVSANLGMSYSITNVMAQAGIGAIMDWLPVELPEGEVRNWAANRMIRPTTVSQNQLQVLLEQVFAREALRLSMEHHRTVAVGLKGIQQRRQVADILNQTRTGRPLVDPFQVDIIIGSGGILSHSDRRQALAILLDGLQPTGITRLYIDSVFMLPHLGIISRVNPKAAMQLLRDECLLPMGTCVAPVGKARPGQVVATVKYRRPDGRAGVERVVAGEIKVVPLAAGEEMALEVIPIRNFDAGEGPGKPVYGTARGGLAGLIIDGRGRPIQHEVRSEQRRAAIRRQLAALGAYSESQLAALEAAAKKGVCPSGPARTGDYPRPHHREDPPPDPARRGQCAGGRHGGGLFHHRQNRTAARGALRHRGGQGAGH